jgi:phospholipid-binding lipoprotein MlaA
MKRSSRRRPFRTVALWAIVGASLGTVPLAWGADADVNETTMAAAEPAAPPASEAPPAKVAEPGSDIPAKLPRSRRDPYERFNRSVFQFNELIDKAALRPLAEGYRAVVPDLARTGVENFFSNFADAWSAANKLLQGKVLSAAQMTLRVATNTVFGLGGLLDPATEFGLERQSEDFGQTLGTWGLPTGPYLVLPVFGPSTIRDASALPLDRFVASPSRYVGSGADAAVGMTMLQLVSTRAGLLSASKLFDDAALDKYTFLRDAYLSRRRNQLYDGNPPDLPDDADVGGTGTDPAPK